MQLAHSVKVGGKVTMGYFILHLDPDKKNKTQMSSLEDFVKDTIYGL